MAHLFEVQNDDLKLLSIKELCRLTGYSRTHIYRLQADGRFPQRVKMSPGKVGVKLVDFKAWFNGLPKAGGPQSDDEGDE